MANIHHATAARAAKSGCEIVEIEGRFGLRRTADEAASRDTWETAKAAADAAADPETVWLVATPEGIKGLKSGVMVKSYHQIYTANGGGCGDTLDATLRAHFTDGTGANLDVAALEAFGVDIGLWNPAWAGLNPGMKRMNLANRIRGFLRRDPNAEITIGETTGRFGVQPKG